MCSMTHWSSDVLFAIETVECTRAVQGVESDHKVNGRDVDFVSVDSFSTVIAGP
jgi:hypothetical protein